MSGSILETRNSRVRSRSVTHYIQTSSTKAVQTRCDIMVLFLPASDVGKVAWAEDCTALVRYSFQTQKSKHAVANFQETYMPVQLAAVRIVR
jgi:hypothetical protein